MGFAKVLRGAALGAVVAFGLGAGAASALPSYTGEVAIQRVSVCTDAGVTCWTPQVDATLLQEMFDPAGLLIVLPAPIQLLNFSFTIGGGGEVDPNPTLSDFRDALSPPAAAHTAYIGGTPEMEGSTIGLAYVGSPFGTTPFGIVQALGSYSLEFSTALLAHEFGHILGAAHDGNGNTAPSSGFLMAASISTEEPPTTFSAASLAYFGGSTLPGEPGTFSTAVPVPAAGGLLALGLGALALVRRRAGGVSSPAGSS
ncbi:M12 family metallo-peptidase [Albimonas sp. CAU 1670]|uniref:M12 family metallo-peptidase n=1 Tax=Albimonas sp. CAU 1670 TaxID=3032599 RepID=UPI0023DBC3BF|nr:M12 family metallo-peptidase [Albimonas sp. CAU 1670]MDF2232212.1 M12 family metallo-peptidase [Albimonas sp. CAU 1670]